LASCLRDLTSSFAERLVQVVLDGARADKELSGDLSVGVSLCRERVSAGAPTAVL
jgi:hypothetical protein